MENPDSAFWCKNCNTKLQEEFTLDPLSEEHKKNNSSSKSYSLTEKSSNRGFKILVLIPVIPLIIMILFLLFNFYPMIVTGFEGIYCQINEDFWFEENKLICVGSA